MARPSNRPRASLVALRRARGLGQAELAVRAGLAVRTLSLAESHGIVTAATASKLAPVLNVTPEAVLAAGKERKDP